MRRLLVSVFAILALLMPAQAHAQSGDASTLANIEGLELAIGRSWVEPPEAMGSSGSESTPDATPEYETLSVSALIFQFDSAENAEAGLETFNDEQLLQIERDPNTPASNEFETHGLGDAAYGYEGTFEIMGPNSDTTETAVVGLFVQQDNLVIQLSGQFIPGNQVEIITQIADGMLAAEIGDAEPVYDPNGASTGGLWEMLNAVEIEMSRDVTVFDLEIYPLDEEAVRGDSIVMPQIDLENLGAVPGITGSWHIAYGTMDAGTPAATPVSSQTGPFSIELWVLEFEDSSHASAAAFSMQQSLTEPLRIVSGSGEGFSSEETQDLNIESTGFTGDSLPEGDAGVVIRASGSTVYAARVYTREPAPTPIARNLVSFIAETPAGDGEATVDGLVASGGMWDRFPRAGNESLYGLEPIEVWHDAPIEKPVATPVG